jgi:hypothetical protein
MQRSLQLASVYLFLLLCLGSVAFAQRMSVDFKQAANNHRATAPGEVQWIQSVLQRNNSVYFEGMSVPQRILLTNIAATRGNVHNLTFSHQASRGGQHAYDYLTSYDQAIASASAIAGQTVLVNMNHCGPSIGPPGSLHATCQSMRNGAHTIEILAPKNMGMLNSNNIATSASNYDNEFGDRTIRLYGDAAITSAVLIFNGYTGGRNKTAEYTLTWTSASTSILIEMAAHLAMGDDFPGLRSGIGYGSGLGAGSISGAPYHFMLGRLDGQALGRRDNQIMAVAIPRSLVCDISGPDPVCIGTANTYTFNTPGLTYSWSLSQNSSGASIVGSSNGQSVVVNAGTGSGGYTLTATVGNGYRTETCDFPVIVNDLSAASNATPVDCSTGYATVTVKAFGGSKPYRGNGVFNRPPGKHTFIVTDANNCEATTSVTIAPYPDYPQLQQQPQFSATEGHRQ